MPTERRRREGCRPSSDTDLSGAHLPDAIASSVQAGGVCSHVIVALACARGCPLRGIESALRHRPTVALVFVVRLLVGGLPILRIRDNVRAHRSLGGRLLLNFLRRRDGFVLTYGAVILIVGVIRVVVRNAAPPIGGVIERQRRKIKPEPKAAPAPATPPETMVKSAIAVVKSATAVVKSVAAAVPSTTAAVPAATATATATATVESTTTAVACSQRGSAAQRQCRETGEYER
jgi:hypothetical protein